MAVRDKVKRWEMKCGTERVPMARKGRVKRGITLTTGMLGSQERRSSRVKGGNKAKVWATTRGEPPRKTNDHKMGAGRMGFGRKAKSRGQRPEDSSGARSTESGDDPILEDPGPTDKFVNNSAALRASQHESPVIRQRRTPNFGIHGAET